MTRFLEGVRIAFDAIWSHKLRTFLTVLGNIVAVTAIISVIALIRGMDQKVHEVVVSEAGADSFVVARVGVEYNRRKAEEAMKRNPPVDLDDLEAIGRSGSSIRSVMARAKTTGKVRYRQKILEAVTIQGVTEEYTWFPNYDVEIGRRLTSGEIRRRRSVAVIGWGVADRLFGGEDPLGKSIRIERTLFRIVGVAAKRGVVLGRSQDEMVVIPLGAFQSTYGSWASLDIFVRPQHPSQVDRAIDDARSALRIHRQLKPSEADNFGVMSAGTLLELWRKATFGIFAVLVGVVTLALVVGGIVIMNIMLMVITERTQEIGLRKALGARNKDIMWQVLAESVTISISGGVAGILLGAVVSEGIAYWSPVPAIVEIWSVLLGISVTALVGLFFGLYPARRAARMDPIEAIRSE